MIKPENCGTTFCSCIECVNDDGPEWYLKQVDETQGVIEMTKDDEQEARVNAALTEVFGYALRASAPAIAIDVPQPHTREQPVIFGSPAQREALLHKSLEGAQQENMRRKSLDGLMGHTREQIGLQLDDRREGLDAHHVYCRTIGEDV